MKKVIWSLAALSVLGCGGFWGTKKSKSNQPVVAASPVPTVNALPVTDASPAPMPEPTVVGTTGPNPEVTVAPTPEVTVAPTAAPVPTVVGPDLPVPAGPKYADFEGILSSKCFGCHVRKNIDIIDFESVKLDKERLIIRIEAGTMPPPPQRGIPDFTFKNSEDGQKLINWLKTGSDLQ